MESITIRTIPVFLLTFLCMRSTSLFALTVEDLAEKLSAHDNVVILTLTSSNGAALGRLEAVCREPGSDDRVRRRISALGTNGAGALFDVRKGEGISERFWVWKSFTQVPPGTNPLLDESADGTPFPAISFETHDFGPCKRVIVGLTLWRSSEGGFMCANAFPADIASNYDWTSSQAHLFTAAITTSNTLRAMTAPSQ